MFLPQTTLEGGGILILLLILKEINSKSIFQITSVWEKQRSPSIV